MINFSKVFNYPIYEVGGCVRDSLLKIPIKDTDIASDLPPVEFKKLCRKLGFKTHDTGIEHGTITVIIDGICYEHTTFRKDVSCDGRNATIEFSKTIEEDLSRRDFTINAIAKLGDDLIDPFNGQEDLKKKILRSVGDPHERFSEDYLRIVRAARFISRLNLTAEQQLIDAAIELSPQIVKHVSIERITDEIRKAQKHGMQFLIEAEKLGFLDKIFPETTSLTQVKKEQWLKTIKLSEDKNELLYFSSILIPVYENEAPKKAASLRMSRVTCKGIDTLIKHTSRIDCALSASNLRDLMVDTKEYYEDVKEYFCMTSNYSEESQSIITNMAALEKRVKDSIDNPFINGKYLIDAGLKPSPIFKEILDDCGRLQAEGKNSTEVEEFAKSKIDAVRS